MPLNPPVLDDRTFEEILSEALLRIPRYTPEWTDWNEGDPGITLLQLFAWLSEMQLYRLNQVPELTYIKLLQLLDMEPRPATPAVAYLSFSPQPGVSELPSVPAATRIAAQSADGGIPVIFETTAGLDVIPVPLGDVMVFDGSSYFVVTAANGPGSARFRPFGFLPQLGSALYLGFAESDPMRQANPSNPGNAVRSFPQSLRLRIFLPAGVPAGTSTEARLVWEYRPQGDPHSWRQLEVFGDSSSGFVREGEVEIAGPKDIVSSVEGPIDEPRYWLRCRLAAGEYPIRREPVLDFLRFNTVAAAQLATVREERLGESEGHPGETFDLRHHPVVSGSLELWLEHQRLTAERWREIDDLLAAGPDDPVYTLNLSSGRLRFGDGRKGRIPTAGTQIIAREYRYGGGGAGNMPAQSITSPLSGLAGLQVTNERPATGGSDEETVDELKRLAPARLRHRGRAVTAEDFAALTREAPGVAQAIALPHTHPQHPGVAVPGSVTVVIVPDSQQIPPRPGADLLRNTQEYLEPYRLLTTEVHLEGPEYLEIVIRAQVLADERQAAALVSRAIHETLNTYLNPLRQELGRDFYPSRFFEVILDVSGVAEVPRLEVLVDQRLQPSLNAPIVVPPKGLVYGGDHHIEVNLRRPEGLWP